MVNLMIKIRFFLFPKDPQQDRASLLASLQ